MPQNDTDPYLFLPHRVESTAVIFFSEDCLSEPYQTASEFRSEKNYGRTFNPSPLFYP